MKKYTLIPLIVLVALFTGAGKYKISKVGQPDVYVPTLDSDAKTLTVESIIGSGAVPVGGMVAVMPNIDGANSWQPPASGVIKDGFMRADGTTITASHRNAGCKLATGTVLPNMVQRYPRGGTTSGATGGANTQGLIAANIPQMSGNFPSGTESANHTHGFSTTTSTDGYHGHTLCIRFTGSGACNYIAGDYSAGGPYKAVRSNDLPISTNQNVSNQSGTEDGGSHSHSAGGTTAGISANHTHTTTVTLGSASPTAVNNEPAYVETVWVIRVK